MADIIKGVLAGAWCLLVGWLLPSALVLAVFGLLVLPELRAAPLLSVVATATATRQAIALSAAAVVVGLVLSAFQTPLYRLLEGYWLWPATLATAGRTRHQRRRAELKKKVPTGPGSDLASAIHLERYLRYPDSDSQIAPTMLGNGIRRFEYYGQDRYCLDSQRLWYQLRTSVPETLAKEVDLARAGVDFFVCSFYMTILLVLSGLATMSTNGPSTRLLVLSVAAVLSTVFCYRGAVIATDAWAAAVRATVDVGRAPLSKALGLAVPATLERERAMWLAVGWFLTFSYEPEAARCLDPFRAGHSERRLRAAPGTRTVRHQ